MFELIFKRASEYIYHLMSWYHNIAIGVRMNMFSYLLATIYYMLINNNERVVLFQSAAIVLELSKSNLSKHKLINKSPS